MVLVVGRREHLALVDEVDAEALQHLGFHEVSDTALRHDGDGHGFHDALDHGGVAHASHAAVGADVGRDALEGHDGHRSRILGDLRLLGVHDVHDDAALHHLREPDLNLQRALHLLGHASSCFHRWPCVQRGRPPGRPRVPALLMIPQTRMRTAGTASRRASGSRGPPYSRKRFGLPARGPSSGASAMSGPCSRKCSQKRHTSFTAAS